MKKRKQTKTIGHNIIDFLSTRCTEESMIRLQNNIEEAVNKTVKSHGLAKVADGLQIEQTINQLFEELTLEIQVLIERSNKKGSKISSQHKLLEAAKNATLKNEPYHLSNYFKMRCLSLLKHYTPEKNKAYLKANQTVKSALIYLAKKGEIHKIKQGRTNVYSITKTGAQPISQNLEVKEIISRDLKGYKSKHILELLRKNSGYAFTSSDISPAVVQMMAVPAAGKGKQGASKYINNIYELSSFDFSREVKAIAAQEFDRFLRTLNLNEERTKQELMAMLVLAVSHSPERFKKTILSAEQQKMGTTNCVKSFLNDSRFSNLFLKSVSRTTAHYRLKAAEEKLKNLLKNNCAKTQSMLVTMVNGHLGKLFDEWAGDGNE
jgi:predicted transcriptional regulator